MDNLIESENDLEFYFKSLKNSKNKEEQKEIIETIDLLLENFKIDIEMCINLPSDKNWFTNKYKFFEEKYLDFKEEINKKFISKNEDQIKESLNNNLMVDSLRNVPEENKIDNKEKLSQVISILYKEGEDKLYNINKKVISNINKNCNINKKLFEQEELLDEIDDKLETNKIFIKESKKLLIYFSKSIYKDKCTIVLSIIILLLIISIIIFSIIKKTKN